MACRESNKPKNSLNSPSVGGKFFIPRRRVKKPLLTREEIHANIQKNLVKRAEDPQASPSKNNLKKEVKIPINEINFEDLPNSLGVGKRLVLIDNVSYGPSIEQRQAGVDFTVQGEQLLDSFRITSGRYWTTTSTGENLFFLANIDQYEKKVGAPYSVVDYDFGESERTMLSDLDDTSGDPSSRIEQDLDTLTRKLNGTKTQTTGSQFATQQWVLVRSNSSFVKPENPIESRKRIREKNKVGTRAASSYSYPRSAYFLGGGQVRFDEPMWNAYWFGGTPRLLNNLTPSRRAVPSEPEIEADENVPIFEPVIRQGEEFVDHSFELNVPFGPKEIEKYNGLVKPLFANFEGVYNFYINSYENGIKDPNLHEAILPNLYVLASEIEEEAGSDEFFTHITLDDTIDKKIIPYKAAGKKIQNPLTFMLEVKKNVGQYFDNFARSYKQVYTRPIEQSRTISSGRLFSGKFLRVRQNVRRRTVIESIRENFKNLIFPIENVEMLRKYEEKKILFPMYYNIEISTDNTTTIAQILKDSKLSVALESRVANGVYRNLAVDRDKYLEVTELTTFKRLKNNSASVPEKQIEIKREEYRSWDISRWMVEFDQKDGKAGEGLSEERRQEIMSYDDVSDIGVFLGPQTQDSLASSEPQMKFFRQLLKIIFVGKLRKLVKQKFRTFEDLMRGKLAYSETVLYRIEKQTDQGVTLQNFYFPNSNEIEVLKFIDTQVKYNKQYIYKVYAYQAVIGTKYEYSDLMTVGDYASFLVTQYPSIRLVEVPYFEHEGRIIDSPSVAPEIEPIPYRGVADKMLFFLRSNNDDYVRQPIYIEPADQQKYNEYRVAKGLDLDDPIRFRTDDHTGVFQIFRTTVKPKSYGDFTGKMIAAVETDVSKLTPQSATAAAYVDQIQPNTKYYYTTRVVDIHDHISYPGPVYEVELVEERGNVYPLTSIVNFAEEVPRKPSRSGKKYMMIAPALPQMLIDENKTGIVGAETAENVKRVFLGVEEERVWGKKFKVRLTSKQTGKKIDLNLDFSTVDTRIVKKTEQQNT